MGKKVSNGTVAAGKRRESQVRSQLQVDHGRSDGHADRSSELPSSQGKVIVLTANSCQWPSEQSASLFASSGRVGACSPLLQHSNENTLRTP